MEFQQPGKTCPPTIDWEVSVGIIGEGADDGRKREENDN